jgi:DNA 3'-phosphatase
MVPKKMVWDHPVSSVLRYYPDEWDVYKEVKLLGGFDLDWTLIRPLKGFFSKGSDDIALLPRRKEYLHFLVKQGLIIVIFTNQRCRNEKEVLDRKQRLDYFLRLMEIPLIILASLKEDEYRKPHIGMFLLW